MTEWLHYKNERERDIKKIKNKNPFVVRKKKKVYMILIAVMKWLKSA